MEVLRRLGVPLLSFIFVVLLSHISRSFALSSSELQIVSAERRIDLTSHIVRVYVTLKVENTGVSSASEVLLAFPPAQVEHIAELKALVATEKKKKKKSHTPLDVNQIDLPDAPNGTKYFSISLVNPLSKGECESSDPDSAKKMIEELLKKYEIRYSYSHVSKFAIFMSRKLP